MPRSIGRDSAHCCFESWIFAPQSTMADHYRSCSVKRNGHLADSGWMVGFWKVANWEESSDRADVCRVVSADIFEARRPLGYELDDHTLSPIGFGCPYRWRGHTGCAVFKRDIRPQPQQFPHRSRISQGAKACPRSVD
jgi:hypothetical protein